MRIKIRLKLWRKGKLVLDTTRRKKTQVLLQLKRVFHDRSHIRVTYIGGDWNESEHQSDLSLKEALVSYTEKSLLDFVEATISGQK